MTLPAGWIHATVGDVTEYVSRGKSPKYVETSDLPVVNQRAVRWDGVDLRHLKYVDPETAGSWTTERSLQAGDLLWNSTGTGTIGRAALYEPIVGYSRVVADSHVTVVRPNATVLPKYLFNLVRSPAVQTKIADMQSGSTNQVELARAAVLDTPVPLPPAAEQRRIVAKLDALTARLARARAELDRVPVLTKRWREGALANAYQSAIRSGSIGASDLCTSIADGDHQAPPKATSGVPFITISAMNDGRINLAKATRFVPDAYAASLKATRRPRTGDVLYSVTGSIGIPALVRSSAPFVFQRHIAILRPNPGRCDSEWLAYMLAAPQVLEQAQALATGTAQLTIPLGGLRNFILPLSSLAEQRAQVLVLNSAFARADRLEAEAARARALLDRLEAAILAKAFRGELVPQDPDDEPASVLLERIRARCAAAPRPKRGRKPASGA